MLAALGAALVVTVAAFAAAIAVRWLGAVTDPARIVEPTKVPFLGGHPPPTHAWSRFHARYYVVALVFVAFEMEMMFMYPWAVVFVEEGVTALVEMGMFLFILGVGIVYAWREGVFRWA
ncbi:MAG TPA: NADH-quinone oxidoreductase subunit A [Nitriliruptorales bacterium]|nr:NADH-quinone oxidoreductase subunit A [Nitriliruptorales bacterium]